MSRLVDWATSVGLNEPNWTINISVCEAVNQDPSIAKAAVKRLKKKINSKKSKTQLLALTLLETLMKNCGDVVHMHVAERDVPLEMVKIVKKKPDFRVKEKILILIDTWQEVFGGPRAQYQQYFVAYQELLHSGMVFPQRTENFAPIFTPPQTQPISYPHPMHIPDYPQPAHGPTTSAAHDISILSLTEIQNARGIMDVLAEMLNALDPANRQGLKQEVIVDLVQQCHSYKQRVVHLVNTTTDEALLQLSLSLNDDLERLLAKHDAIASGTAAELEKSNPSLDIGAGKTKTTPLETITSTSGQSSVEKLPPPAQSSSDKNVKTTNTLLKMNPHMDLLSGDDLNAQTMENSLALVPVTKSLPISASDQNVLALADMFAQNDNAHNNNIHSLYSVSQVTTEPQILKPQQAVLHSVGNDSSTTVAWNNQNNQSINSQEQSHTFGLNSHANEALPLPPWETPTEQNDDISQHIPTPPIDGTYPQQMQSPSVTGMNPQQIHIPPQVPTLNSYPLQGEQMIGAYQYPMQSHQMANIPQQSQYLQNEMGGVYPYTPQSMAQQYYNQSTHPYPYLYPTPTPNDISQRFHGFSMQDNSSQITASSLSVESSHQEPSKPVDVFFGDLVSIAKSKPNKPPPTNQSTI